MHPTLAACSAPTRSRATILVLQDASSHSPSVVYPRRPRNGRRHRRAQRPSAARQRGGSAAIGRTPAFELLARFRPRRIDAEDRAAFGDLLLHEILERRLL